MTTGARSRRDGLERQIEAALDPGCFVGDRECFSFVEDLEEVEREVARLVETEPDRAVSLYEAFLAGCHEKAEEIDDSSGSFGGFVGELFCGWANARQAASANPGETAACLLGWMEDDPTASASVWRRIWRRCSTGPVWARLSSRMQVPRASLAVGQPRDR